MAIVAAPSSGGACKRGNVDGVLLLLRVAGVQKNCLTERRSDLCTVTGTRSLVLLFRDVSVAINGQADCGATNGLLESQQQGAERNVTDCFSPEQRETRLVRYNAENI